MAQLGFFRRSAFNDAVALGCVPIFALMFTQMNLGPSGVDPWLYFGYGTNFSFLLEKFGWVYFAARLPWIGAINLFTSALEPRIAVLALGMVVSCIGSISLYAILRQSCSRTASFLAAFALQANAWYLGHSFWLYVDSPIISLSLLCIALLLRGIHSDRKTLIALAGILFAAGINIHPMLAVLVLSALGFILLSARPRIARCIGWALWFCLGALIATVALCTAAWFASGNFFYFMTTVTTVQSMIKTDYGELYQLPFLVWANGATALAVPVGAFCWAVIVLTHEFRHPSGRRDLWIFSNGVFLSVFWLVLDVAFRVHVNQHTFYFIYLWVPTFLIIGGLIDRLCDKLGPALPVAVIGSVVLPLLTLVVASPYWPYYLRHRVIAPALVCGILGVLLIASCAPLLLGSLRRSATARAIGILASVGLFSVASAADHRGVATGNFELYPVIWFPNRTQPDITATVDAQRFIENNIDPSNGIIFWYSKEESRAQAFLSICAAFRYWFLNEAMPALPNTDLLGAPLNLVMLASDTAKLDEALVTLRGRGFLKEVVARSAVGTGAKRTLVWVVATRSTAEAARFVAENPARP